jgi:hypothetical protein
VHQCDECRRAIPAGTHYEQVDGLWDGCWSHYKTCKCCWDLRQFVLSLIPCFCWTYTNLHSDALDVSKEYASEAAGLRFGVLRRRTLALRQPEFRRVN